MLVVEFLYRLLSIVWIHFYPRLDRFTSSSLPCILMIVRNGITTDRSRSQSNHLKELVNNIVVSKQFL